MPEGPEIAREADRIRAAIGNRRVEAVRFAFPDLDKHATRFDGARVRTVRARGKALLIGFENGLTIYSHNQLYGRWFVGDAGGYPKTDRQLRLAIETAEKWALLYSASEIAILDDVALREHPYLRKLGPDALDDDLSAADVDLRLSERRFARRGIGGLLLDQSFVSGLGNYLRSEICFEARIHPDQRPADLDPAARRRLARAIVTITRRAYRSGGVTLPASRARTLKREGESWSRARHWLFARDGETCRRCDAPIVRVDLAGRRIYLCPTCQPRAADSASSPRD